MKSTCALYLKPGKTNDWYTPREITQALGKFDLDPCTGNPRPWNHARINWTKATDGLSREWFGRIWMNPPYSGQLIKKFVTKFVDHNNGIALVFPRVDTGWFQDLVANASLIFLRRGRIAFCKFDGTIGGHFLGNVFVARGEYNAKTLLLTGWKGLYLKEVKL